MKAPSVEDGARKCCFQNNERLSEHSPSTASRQISRLHAPPRPIRRLSAIAAGIIGDLRFRRKAEQFHSRGPRVVAEFLAELGSERSLTTLINQKLDRYTAISDEALDAAGTRDFPPVPLHGVRR